MVMNLSLSFRVFTAKLLGVQILDRYFYDDMGLIVRKPVFGLFDQVRHKPGCTATEDG